MLEIATLSDDHLEEAAALAGRRFGLQRRLIKAFARRRNALQVRGLQWTGPWQSDIPTGAVYTLSVNPRDGPN